MTNKTITIAIPIYNVEKYLQSCLSSIAINKNYEDVEILLINDGSPAKEEEICRPYIQKYSYMRYIRKENGGYGSVINFAIAIARGKYFKMLDSDDMFNSETFQEYLSFVRQANSDIIVNDVDVFDNDTGKQYDKYSHDPHSEKTFDEVNLKAQRLFVHNFAIRTELLRGLHCPEKCLYTDAALLCYGIARSKTISSTGISLYKYRKGRTEQSASINVVLKHIGDYEIVYRHICDNYHDAPMPSTQIDFFFEILDCVLNNYLRFTIGTKRINSLKQIQQIMKHYKAFKKQYMLAPSVESATVKLLSKSALFYLALIPKFSKEIK